MKRLAVIILIPAALALLTSLLMEKHGWEHMLFNLHLYDRKDETEQVKKTIKQFNIDFATVFNTGGSTHIIDEYPASNLVKRRTYHEANLWAGQKRVIVYDRDRTEIEDIRLYSPFTAVVVAREDWYINVQDSETRKYLTPLKANVIKVRYFLRKYDSKGWIVEDYEVFNLKDEVSAEVKRLW
jgi:hypothetical protein